MSLYQLTTRYGFYKLCELTLDDTNKISRKFAKPKEFTNVLYAIVVNGNIQYIGKASCLWKRFDTYRNCRNWKGAFQSNTKKTELIENSIRSGLVSLYIYRCPSITYSECGHIECITTMHDVEPHVIRSFNPEWNKHYASVVPRSY